MIEIGTSGRGSVILRVYITDDVQMPRIDVPEGSVVEVHITSAHPRTVAKTSTSKPKAKNAPVVKQARIVSLDAPLPTPRRENTKLSALKLAQRQLEIERLNAEMDEYYHKTLDQDVFDGQPVNPAVKPVESKEADHKRVECWACDRVGSACGYHRAYPPTEIKQDVFRYCECGCGLRFNTHSAYPSARGMRNPNIKDPRKPNAWTQPDSSDSSDYDTE
jgi:hypothetical protein